MEQGMSKKEFAERIGVSIPTVDRMIRKGKVKPVRIGTRVIFREHHVKQVLDTFDTSKQRVLREANLN